MTVNKTIPEDALNRHLAIVGNVGSGKTVTAKGFVEWLLDEGRRVIVLDPTGVWWGLRMLGDGKRESGWTLPIFGGEHGDLPLPTDSGAAIAEALCATGTSAIIDLSAMLIGQRHTFMEKFAEALHRLNRGPLHLVIDEADEFAPQKPLPETTRMLHQVDRIVRRGRVKGFRVMMITQRPAVINKNVLTQLNTLIAMRITSPQDRAAVENWMMGHGDRKQVIELCAKLARFKTGTGLAWSPEHEFLQELRFPMARTFDSSKAPEFGDEQPALRKINLDALNDKLAAMVEKARAEDPAVLKKRIQELEAQQRLQLAPAAAPPPTSAQLQAEYNRGLVDGQMKVIARLQPLAKPLDEVRNRFTGLMHDAGGVVGALEGILRSPIDGGVTVAAKPKVTIELRHKGEGRTNNIPMDDRPGRPMSKVERLILTALAQHGECSKRKLALLAGYAVNGGGFNNGLSSLRSKQLIAPGDPTIITSEGALALGSWTALPSGGDRLRHWLGQLSKAEGSILTVLAEAWPAPVDKRSLAAAAGYEANGGGFNNALSRLRTLELINRGDPIKASEELFA